MSGEDPFLGFTMVQPAVRGIQSQGVIACAKHYALNSQEINRAFVSSECVGDLKCLLFHVARFSVLLCRAHDERVRFEMYYMPFRGAIEAGVGSIMVH